MSHSCTTNSPLPRQNRRIRIYYRTLNEVIVTHLQQPRLKAREDFESNER